MKNKVITSLLNLIKVKSILTFIAAYIFIYCVYTGKLEDATITAILMMVFQSLFDKDKRKDNK